MTDQNNVPLRSKSQRSEESIARAGYTVHPVRCHGLSHYLRRWMSLEEIVAMSPRERESLLLHEEAAITEMGLGLSENYINTVTEALNTLPYANTRTGRREMCAAISFAEREVRSKEGMFNYFAGIGDQPSKVWRTKIHMSWVNLCEEKFNLRLLRAAYAQMSKIAGKQRADQRAYRELQARYSQAQDAIINPSPNHNGPTLGDLINEHFRKAEDSAGDAAPISTVVAVSHGPNNGE